jgi:hypothetical protein
MSELQMNGGGSASARTTAVQASNEWWQQLDQRVYQCIKLWFDQWWEPQHHALLDAVGEVFGQHRTSVGEAITKLKERIVRLETTSSFEDRFDRLANDVKSGSEVRQAQLLAKIEALQRELDALKQVAGQPGPPGPPGKLPLVKEYVADRVHYEADVVTHTGALWQARGDTVHAPPHPDWVCLARAGRDGLTPTVRGTYNVHDTYKQLDIVALDGAAFIAKKNAPGLCPGDGWQMISRQGRQGHRGECGPVGPAGKDGKNAETRVIRLHGWRIDSESYAVVPLVLDGRQVIDGPELGLRKLFEQYQAETSQ